MDLKRKIYKTELNNETAILEISELAHQANAAVIGRHGDTTVLATVVMGEEKQGLDHFPLTIDYEERFYAAGKIIGSRFIRREGRPSDEAVLSGRLIDRTIRPLFDYRFRREIQVVVTILAYDEKNDPDAIALLSVSTALGISDIPWHGPVAGVKFQDLKSDGTLNYQAFFAGPEQKINMVEFEGSEVPEQTAVELFEKSQKEIERLIDFQKQIIREIGKPKIELNIKTIEPDLKNQVTELMKNDLNKALEEKALSELKSEILQKLTLEGKTNEELELADQIFEQEVEKFVHEEAIDRNKRPDGRKFDEIRELYAEAGLLSRTHGSGLFIRGDTQILAVTTLATPSAEQLVETMETTSRKRFMLHYNFPGFSTGEISRSSRGPGRREIGHGALAAKALNHLIPSKDEFPYTIRVVAETLSSNGSSSMASTCAASLSLMDAGVPIKKHVGGIAMGLMYRNDREYKILTDLQGPEDHHGDMDLKVAGTEDGVTAIQMDAKIEGITREIFEKTLAQAKKARLQILELMKKTIPAPRPKVSPFAPTIVTLTIPPEKIGLVVGPGGRTINGIIATSGGQITIDIEQTGKIYVAGTNPELVEQALKAVQQIVREYQVGEIVEGTVVKILDFGAIVDLGGDQDGMIHVSELKDEYVKKVEDVVKVGDRVKVKIVRVEPDGKIGLSLKSAK